MEEKHTILDKKELATDTFYLKVKAPLVAEKARAGQFVVVRIDTAGERIPLTIASSDKREGTIAVVFLRLGYSTALLSRLEVGDSIEDVLGPLGHATDLTPYKKTVFVGGGVGNAELYPVVAQYHRLPSVQAITIIGAKTKERLFWQEEFKKISDQLYICTDDGSSGRKAFVTKELNDVLTKIPGVDLVYAVGPIPMMESASALARQFNKKAIVSLNSIMVDGTGMCGSCRITYQGKTKFVCVDGPDFDAAGVDFAELKRRTGFFKEHECVLTRKLDRAKNE